MERVGVAVTLYTCIQHVLGLNLGRDVHYSVSRDLPQSLQRSAEIRP
jgi:hypothetical protein